MPNLKARFIRTTDTSGREITIPEGTIAEVKGKGPSGEYQLGISLGPVILNLSVSAADIGQYVVLLDE